MANKLRLLAKSQRRHGITSLHLALMTGGCVCELLANSLCFEALFYCLEVHGTAWLHLALNGKVGGALPPFQFVCR